MPGPLTRVCLIQLPSFALASWTLLSENDGPSPRFAHTAALGTNQALWVHAGKGDERFLDDLSVPARSGHIAVWDSRNRAIWIHGGFDGALRQDLWKFDTESSNWFSVDSSYQPSARAYHVAALDEVNQELWVHGGYDGGTWSFT